MGIIDISRLSTDERLELIGELWDSLHPDAVGLSSGQLNALEDRLARFDTEKQTALPWADVEVALFERQS